MRTWPWTDRPTARKEVDLITSMALLGHEHEYDKPMPALASPRWGVCGCQGSLTRFAVGLPRSGVHVCCVLCAVSPSERRPPPPPSTLYPLRSTGLDHSDLT